jgi:hypothetical protein
LLLGSLAASSAVLAACGGSARRPPAPELRHRDAAQLIAIARRFAREVPSDRCAAARDAADLGTRARSLVAAGRVPAPLRAPLLAGVAAVAAKAPACPPPAPPAAALAVRTGKGKGHGPKPGHGRGHDKGKGHGHEDGDDQGD